MINTSTWRARSCIVNLVAISSHVCEVEVGRTHGGWGGEWDLLHMTGTVQTVSSASHIFADNQGVSDQFGFVFEWTNGNNERGSLFTFTPVPALFWMSMAGKNSYKLKMFYCIKKKETFITTNAEWQTVHFVCLRSEPNSTWMWKRKPWSADKSIFVPHSLTSPSQLIAYFTHFVCHHFVPGIKN